MPNNKNKLYLCWLVTLKCNLHCPHCFAPSRSIRENIFHQADLVPFIKNIKPNHLSITGGEPFLYPELTKIIKLCSYFVSINITTNGTLVTEQKIDLLINYLSSITISLDSLNQKTLDLMRPKSNLENIISNLKMINNKRISIRINTAISRLNINSVDNIGEFIMNDLSHSNITWKIIMLTVNTFNNRDQISNMLISRPEFSRFYKNLLIKFPKIKITCFSEDDMNSYFMLLPNGKIISPNNYSLGHVSKIESRIKLLEQNPKHNILANKILG